MERSGQNRDVAVVIEDNAAIREIVKGHLLNGHEDLFIIEVATRAGIKSALEVAFSVGKRVTIISDNDLEDLHDVELAPTATQVLESHLVDYAQKDPVSLEKLNGVISVTSSTKDEIHGLLSAVLTFEGVKWLHLQKPEFAKLPRLFGALEHGFVPPNGDNIIHIKPQISPAIGRVAA